MEVELPGFLAGDGSRKLGRELHTCLVVELDFVADSAREKL